MINENISKALSTYNNTTNNNSYFSILDALVLDTIASGSYKTDAQLATLYMCSASTIKRSINKLCSFGFITKHLAHDNTKSLELHQDKLNAFIKTYGSEVI